MPPAPRPRLPAALSAFAILDFLGAAVALAPATAVAAGLGGDGPDAALLAGAGASALVAGLAVVAGMGILQLEEYGRRIQLGLATLGLPLIPLGTLVSILAWSYLTRPATRRLFGPRRELSESDLARARAEQGTGLAAAIVGIVLAVLVLLSLGFVLLARTLAALPASGAGGLG